MAPDAEVQAPDAPALPARRKRAPLAQEERDAQLAILARTALVMAGFTSQDLRIAMEVTREALHATQIKTAPYDGAFIYSRPLVDHATRLEAADRVMRMVPGIYAPKQEERVGGDLTVEIVTLSPTGEKTAIRVSA